MIEVSKTSLLPPSQEYFLRMFVNDGGFRALPLTRLTKRGRAWTKQFIEQGLLKPVMLGGFAERDDQIVRCTELGFEITELGKVYMCMGAVA